MQNNSSKNLFSNSQELNINTNINNSNNIIKNNKFINYPEVFGNFKVIVYLSPTTLTNRFIVLSLLPIFNV